MKKFLIIILIVGALGAGGYFGYGYYSTPRGFVSKEEVLESFFASLNDSDVCEKHYDVVMVENCEHLVSELKADTIVVTGTNIIGGDMNVSVTINGNAGTFVATFVTEDETGLQARFNSTYYKISYIE